MSKEKIKALKEKIEALVIAIPREEDAYEFYMDLAEKSPGREQKEMFVFLANQESMHKDRLEDILKELQDELEGERPSILRPSRRSHNS